MAAFSIIPGVLETTSDENEICYSELRQCGPLPSQGGVGTIPIPIRHQGLLPICTGMAAANCRMITNYLITGKMVSLSGMFIYKMNRLFDGLSMETKGSTVKASMQTLQAKGVCQEALYPSNWENCLGGMPSQRSNSRRIFVDAARFRIQRYARCVSLEEILRALSDGRPVAFSMIIYTDFYEAKQGLVRDRRQGEKIGGHSMVAVNYDCKHECIQVLQSWGRAKDGPTDRGYMYIPFHWFEDCTDEGVPLLIEAFTLL